MRTTFLLVLVFSWSFSCISQEADTILLITPFGKPEGKEVSIKMGKEGGTLRSDDGVVELIIPPGALDKKISISIQAATNTMQSGGRKSYKLLPEGFRFRNPVQLIFYSDGEEQIESDLYGIAMQNQQGQWYDWKDVVIDTVNHTISASIHHFSYWVNYEKVGLYPKEDKVKINDKLLLHIHHFYNNSSTDEALSVIKVPALPEWTVNGISDGDVESGIIRKLEGDTKFVRYHAPAAVPKRNPVQITAELKNVRFKIGGIRMRNLKVSAKVLVYDHAYEVNIATWGKNTGYCNLGEWTDEGSFIVQMDGDKTKVLDVKNNLLKMTGMEKCKCSPEWINKTTARGIVHISGVQRITVSPPDTLNNLPYQQVKIFFKPAIAVFPKFRFNCPTGGRLPPLPSMRAVPVMIDFLASGEEQLLYENTSDIQRLKITVKPLKKDLFPDGLPLK